MEGSLGGPLGDSLRERVLAREPDFSSIKSYVTAEDRCLGKAPELLGKLLATKQDLREENKLPGITEAQRSLNLLLMQRLDVDIKLTLRSCAAEPAEAEYVQVCMRGQLYVHRRYLRRIAA